MDRPGSAASPALRELDVVGVGEISLDRVLSVPRLPIAGDKVTASGESDWPGGQIATALLGCARLGLRCAFVGALGKDAAAELALAPLGAAGIDLQAVQQTAHGATRQALILVETAGGERAVIERRDPQTRLNVAVLDRGLIERSRALLVDTTDLEAATWAVQVAQETGTAVFLDADEPGPALETLLPWVNVAIVNEAVALAMGRDGTVWSGLSALCALGPGVGVATRGEAGAVAHVGGERLETTAHEVSAVDTTGAGDAFRAGWVAAWARGAGNETALAWAGAAAAINCTGEGAQGALPSLAELEAFLAHRAPR